MSQKRPSRMVTGAEAARIVGVTRQAIYAAIKAGRLPAEKVGGIQLIARATLERWESSHQRSREDPEETNAEDEEPRLWV